MFKHLLTMCVCLILSALLVLSSQSAQAQDTNLEGINLYQHRPAIDQLGFIGVNSATLPKQHQFFFRLSGEFADTHLFSATITRRRDRDIVKRVITSDIMMSWSPTTFLVLAADLPVYAYARELDVVSIQEFTTQGLGDARFATKIKLLNEGRIVPALALMGDVTFPSGDDRKFFGTDAYVPTATLLIGKDLHVLSVEANVGATFAPNHTVASLNFNDQLNYSLGLKVPLHLFEDPEVAITGEIYGQYQLQNPSKVTSPIGFQVGFVENYNEGWQFGLSFGGSITNAVGNARFTTLVTVGRALFSRSSH